MAGVIDVLLLVFLMGLSSAQLPDIRVTSFEANSNNSTLEVVSGSSVKFVCEGPSDVQLEIRGQRSNLTIGNSVNKVDEEKTMFCNSTDTYVCTPMIGLQTGPSKNVTVNVRCAPELNTSSVDKFFSTVEGKTLEMRFTINAYPPPTEFNLVQTGNKTVKLDKSKRRKREIGEVPRDNYQVMYIPLQPPQGMVVLQLHGLGEKDSGQYSLSVKNGIGGGLEVNFNVNVREARDDDDDNDDKIHAIIGSVCGVIGALAVIISAICGIKKCRQK